MPSLDKIEKFVEVLNSLGHEPEVLKERGEALQKLKRPEQGLSSDLQDLFQDLGDLGPAAPPSAEEAPPADQALDFSAILEEPAAPEQAAEALSEPGPEPEFGQEPGLEPELELGPEPGPEPEPGLDLDAGPELGGPETPERIEAAEAETIDEADFQISEPEAPPSVEAAGEEFSMPEEFVMPEPVEPEAPAAGGEPEEAFEEPGAEPSFEEPPVAGADMSEAEGRLEEMKEEAAEEAAGDEFSLGDFGAQFGLTGAAGGAPQSEEELNPASGVPETASETVGAVERGEGFALKDEEFSRLQDNLKGLPRNVKLAVEQIVGGSKAPESEQIRIIRLLVSGAPPQLVAEAASKVLGKTLRVPRGYERKTFEELEAEKRSLAWIFRETILPILKIVAAGAAGLGLLAYLGYNFIYKPLNAGAMYRRGYELIEKQNRYRDGNAFFERAWKEWADRNWHFKYAELFITKNSDETDRYAEEKYEELLRSYADYPDQRGVRAQVAKDALFKKGVLDFARFESEMLERFQTADEIIEGGHKANFPDPGSPGKRYTLPLPGLLQQNMYDYEGLLLKGDNLLAWSAREKDGQAKKGRLEAARRTYMLMREKFGDNPELLFRVMRYWIAAGDAEAALELRKAIEGIRDFKADPAVYSDLAEMLLDQGRADNDVETILMKAYEVDRAKPSEKNLPGIHYNLARYYRQRDDKKNESAALRFAEHLLRGYIDEVNLKADRKPPAYVRRYTRMRLDVYRRTGENLFGEAQYKQAEKQFNDGLKRYEEAVAKGVVERQADLGRLYSGLGDVFYYGYGGYDQALEYYRRAEDNLVADPGIMYRMGYIHYHRRGDYLAAVRDFRRVEAERGPDGEALRENLNLLFAMAAGFVQRRDYFAAEGYYLALLEKLEHRRRQENFRPLEKPVDRAAVEMLMRAYNNYGAVLNRLGRRTGDRTLASRAAYFLTRSSELYENFHRDPASMERSQTKNLGYLNMRAVLQPRLNLEIQIYPSIPFDLASLALD